MSITIRPHTPEGALAALGTWPPPDVDTGINGPKLVFSVAPATPEFFQNFDEVADFAVLSYPDQAGEVEEEQEVSGVSCNDTDLLALRLWVGASCVPLLQET